MSKPDEIQILTIHFYNKFIFVISSWIELGLNTTI